MFTKTPRTPEERRIHRKAYMKEYYPKYKACPKNREKIHAALRKHCLRKWYGLTPETYNEMLSLQKGVCKICQKPPEKRYLGVDHCHATGKVRGLLCHSCNVGLGDFKENLLSLENAIKYLKEHANENLSATTV